LRVRSSKPEFFKVQQLSRENRLCIAEYYFPIEEGVCLESFVAKYAVKEVKAIFKEKE
jgi:hypothetical protein